MVKKYLDQQGLQTLIQGLKAKNDALYAAIGHAHAANEISYKNDNIKGGADIKVDEALDVLVANVVRATEDLSTTDGNVKELEEAINALKAQVGEGTVVDKIQAVQTALDSFKVTQATKDGEQDTAIEAAKAAADAAQTDVDALEEKVGTVAEGKTVVELISDAKKAGTDAAAAEATRAQGVEQGLRTDLGDKDDTAAADGSAFARIAQVKADLADEVTRAKEAEKKAQAQADANKAAIEVLNGDDQTAGSVKKQIADKIAEVNQAAGNLENRVKANEDAIKVINGDGEGSIKKAVADLVSGAPEAMNTLSELAQAIQDHQDVYTGYVAQVAKDIAAAEKAAKDYADGKDTALHTTITGEIATAKQEAKDDAASKDTVLENKLQAKIDDKVDQTAYDTKVAALEKADTDNLAAAKKFAQDEDKKITDAIGTDADASTANTVYGKIKALQEKDAAQDTVIGTKAAAADLTALQGVVGTADDEAEADTVFGKIKAEAARAKGAEDALGERIDALVSGNNSVDAKIKAAVGDVDLDNGETISSYVTEKIGDAKTELQGKIDTNATAIATLNGADTVEGSVAKAVKIAKEAVMAEVDKKADQTALSTEIQERKDADKALVDRLDIVQGAETVDGSIAKALKDAKTYTDTQIDGMALTEAEIDAMLAEVYSAPQA